MIGSFSSIVIIFMIVSSVLMFTMFTRQEFNYNKLSTEIQDTQSKINTLSDNILITKLDLQETKETLDVQIDSISDEFDALKASAGEDFSNIIEEAVKGVVTIRTDVGQGTGFLITDDGYIVTNAHVLVGGRQINALTYEQGTMDAEFIGYDPNLDIALLKIKGDHERLRLGDSEGVQVGEKVIAIGNPLGLQFSVSQGIVSAVHRAGPTGVEAYIQTDAALNPGNSGGPLINTDGRVIGINNFKVGGSESLGFSLESNFIEDAVNAISQERLNQTLI